VIKTDIDVSRVMTPFCSAVGAYRSFDETKS